VVPFIQVKSKGKVPLILKLTDTWRSAVSITPGHYLQKGKPVATKQKVGQALGRAGSFWVFIQLCNRQFGFEPPTRRLRRYLLWPTNRGRCTQILALEIWLEKVVLAEGWRHIASKRRDMSRCLSVNLILDPSYSNNYIVGRPKIFVYCKLGVAELNF